MNNWNQADRPRKQGIQYAIDLGQNVCTYRPLLISTPSQNGPYLEKDKMSVKNTLINAANYLIEPQEVYDDYTKTYTNHDEKHRTQLSSADNLTSESGFQTVNRMSVSVFLSFEMQQLVRTLRDELNDCKSALSSFKSDLRAINEAVNRDNLESLQAFQPKLKEFYTNLKEQLYEEKNEQYKLQREIDQLAREKIQIQQQIAFSTNRIEYLEKLVGVHFQRKQPLSDDEK